MIFVFQLRGSEGVTGHEAAEGYGGKDDGGNNRMISRSSRNRSRLVHYCALSLNTDTTHRVQALGGARCWDMSIYR